MTDTRDAVAGVFKGVAHWAQPVFEHFPDWTVAEMLNPTTLAVLDGVLILIASIGTWVGVVACRRLRRLQRGRDEWMQAMREFSERADGAEAALQNLTHAMAAEAERRRAPSPPSISPPPLSAPALPALPRVEPAIAARPPQRRSERASILSMQ